MYELKEWEIAQVVRILRDLDQCRGSNRERAERIAKRQIVVQENNETP